MPGIKHSMQTETNSLESPYINTVNLEELENAITLLANNCNVSLSNLSKDSDLYKAHKLVLVATTIFQETDYDIFLSLLEKQPRPSSVYPNTAGAFLFGDFSICYGGTEKWCSPINIGSVPRTKTVDWITKACPHQIWLMKGGYISGIHNNESTTALVYVDAKTIEEFRGFTQKEINAFKNHHVTHVEVLSSWGPIHNVLVKSKSIDSFVPVEENFIDDNIENINNTGNNSNNSTEWNCFGWVGLVLLIILIVVILAWVFTSI